MPGLDPRTGSPRIWKAQQHRMVGKPSNAWMANAAPITTNDLVDMVRHWLHCPVGGYLGSDYGSDIQSLVHSPMASGLADDLIAKLRQDVPLAASAPINIYSYDKGIDQKVIVLEVAGTLIEVGAPA